MPRATPIERQEEMSRLEDYLEVIYHLIHDKGYASTIDIAETLNVKPPTVSSMLQRLAAKDYIVHEPYRGMKLTEKGAQIARSVISRHNTVSELLTMLGVEKGVAYQDTEGIEHHLQPETIHKIAGLVEFLKNDPRVLRAIRSYIER